MKFNVCCDYVGIIMPFLRKLWKTIRIWETGWPSEADNSSDPMFVGMVVVHIGDCLEVPTRNACGLFLSLTALP